MKNTFDEQLKEIHEVIDGEEGSFPNRLNAARRKCELLGGPAGKPLEFDEERLVRELRLLSDAKQKLQLIKAYEHLIDPSHEIFIFWMEQNLDQFLENRSFRDLYSRLISTPKDPQIVQASSQLEAYYQLSRLGKIRYVNDSACTFSKLALIFDSETDSWVISQLVKALAARFPRPDVLEKISMCLDHEDERVRSNTVEALTGLSMNGIKTSEIESLLAPMIRDLSIRVRIAYLRYLYQADHNRVVQLLANELERVNCTTELRSVAWAVKAMELEIELGDRFERKKRELGMDFHCSELDGIFLVKRPGEACRALGHRQSRKVQLKTEKVSKARNENSEKDLFERLKRALQDLWKRVRNK